MAAVQQVLEDRFEETVERFDVLSRADARHFLAKGYVLVRDAFPRALAETIVEDAWRELEQKYAIDRADPSSWDRPLPGPQAMPGYVRTNASGRNFVLRDEAPKALAAQGDVVGGIDRFRDGADLAWGTEAIANLGSTRRRWHYDRRQAGWHKDGWHFRHFLNSPEQGLLTVPIYSDIEPASGGTRIATDSIAPVARLLARHPEGLHPDSVQGGGYLIPWLIDQSQRDEELTGRAGDLVILHPFMLHRVVPNPSPRPRFIANMAPVLAAPMSFDRAPGNPYSLVELAVLHALGVERLEFRNERAARLMRPFPFRDEAEKQYHGDRLAEEKANMARLGVVTPAWGAEWGYDSNRAGG